MRRCGFVYVFSLLLLVFSLESQAGFKEGMDALKRQDYSTAYKEWKLAAERGDVDAQYAFAGLNYSGQGVAQNFQQAFYWYSKVADKGKAPAQFYVGVMYYNGQGVEKSYEQAINWYTKAAEQEIPLAQYNLGVMYFSAQGTERDIKKSIFWYTKAADKGYAPAQYQLGAKYLNGQGIDKDEKQAVAWFTKAAELGYADAQHDLAVMYFDGQGVKTDRKQAAYWDTLASAQGNGDAQYNLALQYNYGRGVKSDKVVAVALLTLSKSDQSSQMLTNMFVHNEISNQEKLIAYKLKDQMQKNGNFINALNNYISSHSVEDISNVNSPTAANTDKVNYPSAAKNSNINSPSIDTDFVKNGMPCMDGICVGDEVSKLKGIKWDTVKKYEFVKRRLGFQSAQDEINYFKNHFVPEKRQLVGKLSSYLIQSKFDNSELSDLAKLSGVCKPFELVEGSNELFLGHDKFKTQEFNTRINSSDYLITNAYEMIGSYTSKGDNKTSVKLALAISGNPENQTLRVKEITRQYPKSATEEQISEIHQQLKLRYAGVIYLQNGWDHANNVIWRKDQSAWSFDYRVLVLKAPIIDQSIETINHLKKYPGCSQKLNVD